MFSLHQERSKDTIYFMFIVNNLIHPKHIVEMKDIDDDIMDILSVM